VRGDTGRHTRRGQQRKTKEVQFWRKWRRKQRTLVENNTFGALLETHSWKEKLHATGTML